MKKKCIVCIVFLVIGIVHIYAQKMDTIDIPEREILIPLQEGNYKIIYCAHYAAEKKDGKVTKKQKGLALQFDSTVSKIFSSAILYSVPGSDIFQSIELIWRTGYGKRLYQDWFLKGGYSRSLYKMNCLLATTAKINNFYEYENE